MSESSFLADELPAIEHALPQSLRESVDLQAGGNLSGSAVYISRTADHELLSALRRGRICSVFAPRQSGKTSLATRTMSELQKLGIRGIRIDLNTIGVDKIIDAEHWCERLLCAIHRGISPDDRGYMEVETDFLQHWSETKTFPLAERCQIYLRVILGAGVPTVIFLDEMNNIPILLQNDINTDDFFTVVRTLADFQLQENWKVTFCLLGVVQASEIIHDPSLTPFNIQEGIQLTDFTFDESKPFIVALRRVGVSNPEERFSQIYNQTEGHPYLTHRLCYLLQRRPEAQISELVDDLLGGATGSRDPNLNAPEQRMRVLTGKTQHVRSVLRMYRDILTHDDSQVNADTEIAQDLYLSGLCRQAGMKLHPRCPLIKKIYGLNWVESQLLYNREYGKFGSLLQQWLDSERRDQRSLLWGEQLNQAEIWAQSEPDLTRDEKEFLRASAQNERSMLKKRWSRNIAVAGTISLLMVFLWMNGQKSRRAREVAEERGARDVAEQLAKTIEERRAREVAEQSAKTSEERRARELAELSAKASEERRAREVAELSAKASEERRAREVAELSAKASEERRAREVAEQSVIASEERRAREVSEAQTARDALAKKISGRRDSIIDSARNGNSGMSWCPDAIDFLRDSELSSQDKHKLVSETLSWISDQNKDTPPIGKIQKAEFSHYRNRLTLATVSGEVIILDSSDLSQRARWKLSCRPDSVRKIELSPDGDELLVAQNDRSMQIVNSETGFVRHKFAANSKRLGFSPFWDDKNQIIFPYENFGLSLLDTRDEKATEKLLYHQFPSFAVALPKTQMDQYPSLWNVIEMPNRSHLLAFATDQTIRHWTLKRQIDGSVIGGQAQPPIDIGPFQIDSLIKANDKEVVIGIASQSIIDGQSSPRKGYRLYWFEIINNELKYRELINTKSATTEVAVTSAGERIAYASDSKDGADINLLEKDGTPSLSFKPFAGKKVAAMGFPHRRTDELVAVSSDGDVARFPITQESYMRRACELLLASPVSPASASRIKELCPFEASGLHP